MRATLPWAFWVGTRVYGILIILDKVPYPHRSEILGDPAIYEQWSGLLADGTFPSDDRWQYPPLAAAVFLAPRLLEFSYTTSFAVLALAMDALIMALLARRDTLAGAWAWTAGLVLLGPISYVRYDLMVTIVAVLALLVLSRQWIFGWLVAVGTMLKVWPVLLLMALPRDRRGAAGLASCAVTGLVLLVSLAVVLGEAPLSFLDAQASRGLECEAVAGTVLMVGRLYGWSGTINYQYGSMELVGPYVTGIAKLCLPLTVVALAVVAVRAWRGSGPGWSAAWGCDVAFAAVLAAVVTSRVLSPQYMLWMLGLGAVCLAHRESRQRPTTVLILIAAALSQFLYPMRWNELMAAEPLETWVLAVRNLLVLAAAILAVVRLRPVSRRAPGPARDSRARGWRRSPLPDAAAR